MPYKLIIGVDFGTTYTGVSWVASDRENLRDVHVIHNWSGKGKPTTAATKTPSRIAYAKENGYATDRWGYEVLPNMKAHTWMKLLLDSTDTTLFDDPSLAENRAEGILRLPEDKTPVQLCADYLENVAKFVMGEMERFLSKETLAYTSLEFWLTVPAVWSDKAKADTLLAAQQAAARAHIRHDAEVYVIAEPEAAALAVMEDVTHDGSTLLVKPGDGVIIADCGGGTVDITTYQVEKLSPDFKMTELLVGGGGKCGSTYIDRRFIKWMGEIFGEPFLSLPFEKIGPCSAFMNAFERHKLDFRVDSEDPNWMDDCLEIPLSMKNVPDSDHYDKDEACVKLSHNDLRMLFQPVVDNVIGLLRCQTNAARTRGVRERLNTVILAGGFAESAFLHAEIEKWCTAEGLRLLCSQNPQATICKGAAWAGLRNLQPQSRQARRHYGFSLCEPYNPDVHQLHDTYMHAWHGIAYARNNMYWGLKKGTPVNSDTSIELVIGVQLTPSHGNTKMVTTKLYCCDLDIGPRRPDGYGVKLVGSVTADMSQIEYKTFPSKIIGGEITYMVGAKLCISFGQKRGLLHFSTKVLGKEVGRTSMSFSGDGAEVASGGLMDQPKVDNTCGMQ